MEVLSDDLLESLCYFVIENNDFLYKYFQKTRTEFNVEMLLNVSYDANDNIYIYHLQTFLSSNNEIEYFIDIILRIIIETLDENYKELYSYMEGIIFIDFIKDSCYEFNTNEVIVSNLIEYYKCNYYEDDLSNIFENVL